MILSHYQAGSGAVLVETREEARLLRTLLAELPAAAQVATVAAPSGAVKDARTDKPLQGAIGLAQGYAWAQAEAGRVLVVHDWHVLCNSPGHWRLLIEALPGLRSPKGAGQGDFASLAVFVAPSWELQPANPLRGSIPLLPFLPPDRDTLRKLAEALAPMNGSAEGVADALCGLTADAAEQAAAECLAAKGCWDATYLRGARRQMLREAGLEILPPLPQIGGLGGFKSFAQTQVIPWLRDPQLAVRRILKAGLPGLGKSAGARWLAHQLGCECASLSVPKLKDKWVGSSEQQVRRALATVDALGKDAPVVVVLNELDAALSKSGNDSGTSSGIWTIFSEWLQDSLDAGNLAIVIGTLNEFDRLDAALASRFPVQFFYNTFSLSEREQVAALHYERCGVDEAAEDAAHWTAAATEGFNGREIAEGVVPEVCRLSNREPTKAIVESVCREIVPISRTKEKQLAAMREAGGALRRANDPSEDAPRTGGRRIKGGN